MTKEQIRNIEFTLFKIAINKYLLYTETS